jgi:succinate-semialdehyde dehydrogenase/glutarate-semialdehyde dehydrogenase
VAYQTINPATGEVLGTVPEISDAELEAAIGRAQTCFETDWPHRSAGERCTIMARAAAKLREKAEEHAQNITLEMGKPIQQARGEIGLSANILDYYAKHGETYLKPRELPEAPGSVVLTQPIGIILGIEPWNFPYYQVARVAGPQLVAGNVVMIKHAESVPQCALAIERLFAEAGAPEGAYTNLFVSIDQIDRSIGDFRIRGVALTGSERAGSAVGERAGKHLKKSVLELGGSDPFIVLEDAPLEPTLDNASFGRMLNAGQSCTASKRFIVIGNERGQAFVDGLARRMSAFQPGDPRDPHTTLGPLFSERALKRLLDQIESAEKAGARIVLGGKRIDRPGFYLEPTILTDITKENPIFFQETFGPVASVYIVESEQEAIQLANATTFGLGSSVFGADVIRAQRVAEKIDSGMVFINQTASTIPETPFGGVKNSGYGRELSELGFGEFVNRKLVRTFPAGTPARSLGPSSARLAR